MSPTVRQLLDEAVRRLAADSPSPRADADELLQHVLQKDRSWLRLREDAAVAAEAAARFEVLLQRRLRGEPVAHLTGSRGFWSLELAVDASTLIPRPDTELIVEWALELLPLGVHASALDLGTGSGAIALALKQERPRCVVTAVERAPAALALARRNGERLGLGVRFVAGDWFGPLAGERFDVIVANPPYIAEDDPHLAQGDLRFEPASALVAGPDGLEDLRAIVAQAPAYLFRDGWLLLEHGFDQGGAVRALLQDKGFADVATRRDLGGNDRITGGRWPC